MNKKLFLAASVLTVSALLAACGSDDTSEGTTEDQATEITEEQNDTTTPDDSTEEESTETETDSTDPVEESEGSEEGSEVVSEEEPAAENPALKDGTLTASDSQAYEIYLLPTFELTGEEPNRDVVYSTDNDALFMRVETFSTDDTDFAFAKDSIQQTVQASNDSAELTELPAFEDAEFINSALYEIPTDDGKVTGVAYEKEGLIVKLTIFDLTEFGITEDFLNMGKTITAK